MMSVTLTHISNYASRFKRGTVLLQLQDYWLNIFHIFWKALAAILLVAVSLTLASWSNHNIYIGNTHLFLLHSRFPSILFDAKDMEKNLETRRSETSWKSRPS
jgi:hypothetical protein